MTDDKLGPPRKSHWLIWLILFIVLGALVFLTKFGLKKFNTDRQSAMNFERPPVQVIPNTAGKTVTRTYTQKDIEEARKKGQKLPGVYAPPATQPGGQAAVQQSLRTLDEINRINEMNRRLNEQQQRQQQQR